MPTPLNILIAEDSEDDALLIMGALRQAGFEPHWHRVETEPDFLAGLQQQPDIILSDFCMPQFSGLRAADLNRNSGRDIPFILISGTVGEEMAVEAMKRGVTDYFLKDRIARLGAAVEQALALKQIRERQKQAEASLKLFRALVDRSSDGIEVIDPESGRLLDVNQTTCDRLGYTRSELLQMCVTDLEAVALEANSWQQMVTDIRRTGFKIVEGRHRRKDGSSYPIEVNVRSVTLDREYLIASVRDITERKRREEAAARLAAIVQSSDDAIVGKTLAGIVTSWNAGAEKLFGYTADEMVGQSIRRLIPPELQPEEDEILTKLWRGESIRHYDTVRQRKDGSRLEVSVTISPVKDAAGKIIGISKIASDNSARKQAELAVRASQERLDRTLEAARIGYWDLNLVTRQANRSMQHARIFGYSDLETEWTYEKFLEHVQADDREEVRRIFLAGVTANTEWNFECRIVRHDGVKRWIWVHGNVVLDAAGAPVEMEGMVSDITDRRHVEKALRTSEQLLQTVMDLVPHFIFAKDSQSRHLFVNQACAAANGLKPGQMIGRNDLELLPDRAQAEGFMRNDQEVIASGKPQIITEEHLTNATGETRIYHTTKIPFQLPNFDGPALVGVSVDITDVKRAEAALRESRAKLEAALASMGASELSYRRLFEAAQDGIVILDEETGRIQDANPFLVKLLGFSHAEMLGQTVGELSPFRDVVSNQVMLERLQKDGYVRYEDLPLKAKDGRDIAVEFVSNVYRAGDKKEIQCNIRDITKRKQAETTSARLAAIVESSGDAIIGVDLAGVFTNWNHGAEKLYGYAAGEMIGAPSARIVPDDRQAEEMEMLERIKAGEQLSHFETVRRTKDGRLMDVSVTTSAIKDAGGKIIGVSTTARDISEHKRAATALLESKRFLQSTLNALSPHIAILDGQGTIVEVNAAWDRFARENGFVGSGGKGENYLQVCHSDTGHRCGESLSVAGGIRDVMAGRKAEFHLEYECHGPQERRWFVVRVTRFAGDGPVRVVVAHENITERKLAEDSLRESEEKFRQIAETINEVFWITDATMHQMIYVSPAYEKIWGRTCQSLYDAPCTWRDAIHAEDRERVMLAATTGLAKGKYDERYRINRPDGSVRWIYDHAVPLYNAAGEISRFIGIAGDVTEERKLEEQFRQAQKMESIGQLAGGIAHDFNNILSAIIGHAYLIKQDAAGNAAVLSSLGAISSAANRATDLVRQILTFSRLGRQEREPVELNEIVLEALKLLRASVPSTIRIEKELGQTPPVLANATAIHQLIMNLGTNAWHAMGNQPGTLKVCLTVLTVVPEFARTHPDLHPGRYVCLSVSDTGIGMDQTTITRIFEPFFTTKGIGEGTGLGLAVVHGIMKNHEGAIIVHSQPGEGTEFQLYFPAVAAEVGPGEANAVPLIPGRGEHVLFVDDEEALTSVAARLLEGQGYLVTSKNSPFAALDVLRAEPEAFDLVITDLTMPGMDGAKLGEELLKIRPQLPMILTSGYSRTMTEEKARELGFLGLLQKPSTPEALIEAVYRALHRTEGK